MTVIGKKYICDRCKTETFVCYIGTKEMDGAGLRFRTLKNKRTGLGNAILEICVLIVQKHIRK